MSVHNLVLFNLIQDAMDGKVEPPDLLAINDPEYSDSMRDIMKSIWRLGYMTGVNASTKALNESLDELL